jgi:hypothetical protein
MPININISELFLPVATFKLKHFNTGTPDFQPSNPHHATDPQSEKGRQFRVCPFVCLPTHLSLEGFRGNGLAFLEQNVLRNGRFWRSWATCSQTQSMWSLSFLLFFICSWLRHYATSRKVAGSGPNVVEFFILPAALWPWGRLSL